MKINKALILDRDDIFAAVKLFAKEKGIDPSTVCNLKVHQDRDGETKHDHIYVELQQEIIK